MAERTEFRLSGSGGQGIITAGIVLAEAAILEGKNAIQTQSYGPEARGGASKAEVVISLGEIDYPKATVPDYLLCLTSEAFRLFGADAPEDTVVIVDSFVQTEGSSRKVISVPIIQTAQSDFKPIVANVIALGFLVAYTEIVTQEAAETALLRRIPKGTEELNKKALAAGFALAKTAV
ncbi:MAG TPA: 2-oxoacid:acceptor oxidoreductase family protein [Clostridia bacterium]|nr:2-oxoacid:acceptor oxidoreductase family protein [Clostridia bacterium]